jgi:hypothetical protein
MTPDEKSLLIGAVLYFVAAFFLVKAPKLWPKKKISTGWFAFWVVLAAAYVIGVTWKGLKLAYREVLTPTGHFLSDPSTWWSAFGILVFIIALIICIRMVKGWWRENVPKK